MMRSGVEALVRAVETFALRGVDVRVGGTITSRTRSGIFGLALVCALAPFDSAPGVAAPAVVIGDSIGVGVSMAGGVPRLAHNSVSIRSTDIIRQLRRVPTGSVAFLSLGTNDAVGSIAGVENGVDRIVQAARSADLRLVWIGPPCVLKPWNANVVKLDALLSRRLAGQIPYVSIADPQLCDRSLRGADGVHFNMRGYSILWGRARAMAGVGIEAGAIQPDGQGARKTGIRKVRDHQDGRRPTPDARADVSSSSDSGASPMVQ